MEKEIIIKNISAKFQKNFAVIGNMDPFLVFKLASSQGQTQVAKGEGLQPRWEEKIKLTTFYQSDVQVVAYHQALTENKHMGKATFDINKLQNYGSHKIEFKDKQQKSIGYVFLDYVIKQRLKYDYTIRIWKISALLYKNYDISSKIEPFLRFSQEQQKDNTQIIPGIWENQKISFAKTVCFGFNEESQKQKIQKRSKQLKIVAYKDALTQHQYIGKVYIVLHSLKKGKKTKKKVYLNGEDESEVGKVKFYYLITDFRKPSAKPLSPQKQCNPSIRVNISKSDRFKLDNSQKQINISKKHRIKQLGPKIQRTPSEPIIFPPIKIEPKPATIQPGTIIFDPIKLKRFKSTQITTSKRYNSPKKEKGLGFKHLMVKSVLSQRKMEYSPGPDSYYIRNPKCNGIIFGKQYKFFPQTVDILKSFHHLDFRNKT